jgi:hypothetical protein
MTRMQAQSLARWLKDHYGAAMAAALEGTPFDVDVACAIACKETGPYLLQFVQNMSADEALAHCVFDASGDYPGTRRSAFPVNTAAFRGAYGDDFADMLIDEANQTRSLRGIDEAQWVYKGYGLFQYDLQHVLHDEAFFRERHWYDFDECLLRLQAELLEKYDATGDVMKAIRAYNGSGDAATVYVTHVAQFIEFSKTA